MSMVKKRRIKWNRVIMALIIVIALVLGIYKGVSYVVKRMKKPEKTEVTQTLFEKLEEAIPTVVIDPGHGGIDAGAKDGKLYEKDIALKTAFALGEALEKQQVRVVYTRTSDEPLHEDKATDLSMRAKMSATHKADFYVSVHVNDSDKAISASGFEIYVKDDASKDLATSIGKYIEELDYSKNRGVMDGSELAVLRLNSVPSVLVELGYIRGDDYLRDDQKLVKLGEAISQGVIEQLKIKLSQ